MGNSSIMSSDTVSSLFPDRPIRPLPKRRLKEKLSPATAESINYPPPAPDSGPLFYYPPYPTKRGGNTFDALSGDSFTGARRADAIKTFRGEDGGDEVTPRSALVMRSRPEILDRVQTDFASQSNRSGQDEHQPSLSASSSVDGYDSFENSSNKKKRKIPTAADSVLSGSHILNNEMSSLAISGSLSLRNDAHDRNKPLAYNVSAYVPSNQGISGSGRGRLGRPVTGRSPLRAIPDGSNSWARDFTASHHADGGGIISKSIANAGKFPQGQENVSLLHQTASNRTTPSSTQFTFTCDSKVAGGIQWPGHMRRKGGAGPIGGTDELHSADPYPESSLEGRDGSRDRRHGSRRRLDRELDDAARTRAIYAASKYKIDPPRPEDIWICEFCEYEQIFGRPPRALIREYEVKDRRRRQEKVDRRKLLEKAKAKLRKGKKTSKAPTKGGPVVESAPGHADEVTGPAPDADHRYSTHSDSDSLVYDDIRYDGEMYSDVDGQYVTEPEPPPLQR